MSKALVLNATFEPLCVVSVRRAVVLVFKGRAEVLHAGDQVLHSARTSLPAPSVIRLTHFVKVPFRARMALSRRAVFARDAHTCQYCGGPAESIDHVLARSRGGQHTWENVVAACRPCNSRKEDRDAADVGLTLRTRPVAPRDAAWIMAAMGRVEPHWEPYLRTDSLSA
ncbi:MAG: HNH endonuclease [Acidimicrobiales bacterium]